MTTGIGNMVTVVVMLFACLASVAAAPVKATAQSGSKCSDDETVTRDKTMVFDGSKQVMARAKMMREAMRTMREDKNPSKARQVIADAEIIIGEGETTLGQALEMAKKHSEVKEKLRLVTERYNLMIQGAKIMRTGMMKAEAMLAEGPNQLARDGKKVYRRLGDGKGLLKLPALAVPDSIAWNW